MTSEKCEDRVYRIQTKPVTSTPRHRHQEGRSAEKNPTSLSRIVSLFTCLSGYWNYWKTSQSVILLSSARKPRLKEEIRQRLDFAWKHVTWIKYIKNKKHMRSLHCVMRDRNVPSHIAATTAERIELNRRISPATGPTPQSD